MGDKQRRLTDRDPLAGSSWSNPGTVEGFVRSPANRALLELAAHEMRPSGRLLDIGCGAGRNAVPLAQMGWRVIGSDLSSAMLLSAVRRVNDAGLSDRISLVQAAMDSLPLAPNRFDFVVAHGIWNLARSGHEFRKAINEAARVAKSGAPLFLFTFSRHTLADDAAPLTGESFVFTEFSGEPQCFLTYEQIIAELASAGFAADSSYPLRELNRPQSGFRTSGVPVIYEGVFRFGTGKVPSSIE